MTRFQTHEQESRGFLKGILKEPLLCTSIWQQNILHVHEICWILASFQLSVDVDLVLFASYF